MKEAATQKLTTNYINYNCVIIVELSHSEVAKNTFTQIYICFCCVSREQSALVPNHSGKMGSLPGSFSCFSARRPLHVPLSVMKHCVSRVTEDPRGLVEAMDPKEIRWDCWKQNVV